MTKEQLLIPRVLVIGGKEGEPNDTSGKYISGDVLTQFTNNNTLYSSAKGNGCVNFYGYYLERFPHLFKPLQWWEFRKVDDMPEFVRLKDKGIFKVDVWDFIYEEAMIFNGDLISTVSIELLTPSTSEEYEEYLKQKEG